MQNLTIETEDKYHLSFGKKLPIAITHGKGVRVWDESGRSYIDFTSGWAVTSLGHAHPVITEALVSQAGKIMHCPNSGMIYSPERAKLLLKMKEILPKNLGKVFFSNSGAEANDAAIKLARKITCRPKVISTAKSFHGRTVGTLSATGSGNYRQKLVLRMPGFEFVPYNNIEAIEKAVDSQTAAVIVEPVQGEGGVRIPSNDYLEKISDICIKNKAVLIVDEIQTGFFRTGPAFCSGTGNVKAGFLTMAKGIAGGFPFGAVAVDSQLAEKIEDGDHGGTYIGNPLGCAVASAVIGYMLENNMESHVLKMGRIVSGYLNKWKDDYETIAGVRGKGLLYAVEFKDPLFASEVYEKCFENGLILNIKHEKIIRIFPALTITEEELVEGLNILENAINPSPDR
jgi:acetylornithine/N-succinyldiaminopimelate aminotransferase